jgi:hypothetical protein
MKPEASADSEDIRGMDDTTEQHRDDIHRIVGRYRTPSERHWGTTDHVRGIHGCIDDTTEEHRVDVHRIVGRYRTPSSAYPVKISF